MADVAWRAPWWVAPVLMVAGVGLVLYGIWLILAWGGLCVAGGFVTLVVATMFED